MALAMTIVLACFCLITESKAYEIRAQLEERRHVNENQSISESTNPEDLMTIGS